MTLRYFDKVQPSTQWEVMLYIDDRAALNQRDALADIFLGRAGGTVAELYGPAIGEVHAVQCGIPGFDHPGTELYGDGIEATDPLLLRFEVRGKRHASFLTDFDYHSPRIRIRDGRRPQGGWHSVASCWALALDVWER